jgi:DNA-directed RNA polymerase specialized sigma24 family protein
VNLVQQTPPHDPQRRRALGKLISLAQPWLARTTTQNVGHQHPLYNEVYTEAIQDLWIWVCDHIEEYNPERSTVLGWLNFYLSRRFFPNAAARVLDFKHRRSWPAGNEQANQRFWETLPDQPTPMDDYLEGLQSYIRTSTDPLLEESIRDRPQATLRRILIYKMAGKSLQEIANIFDSKLSTVHSFYRRRKRLLHQSIKKHCQDEGG